MADNPDITAGTASVVAGTKAVTGVGTFWSTDEIRSGDLFASDGYPGARIDTVNSDTSITLKDNWRGSSLPAGSSYYIRYQPDGSRYAALLAGVRKILSLPNLTALSGLVGAAGRIPIFTGPGTMFTVDKLDLVTGVNADKKVATLAARAAFDGEAEGFSVLVANIGDGRSAIYFKNSVTMGDWSLPAYLTGPNGSFQSKGTYNNATAYVVGDVVLHNNSSWIALQSTTGNAPPALPAISNTFWLLIAAKGSGDVSGPATSVADNMASFSDVTGKQLKDSGVPISSVLEAMRGYISPGRSLHLSIPAGAPNSLTITAGAAASDGLVPVIMSTEGFALKHLDQPWATGNAVGCWLDGASMPTNGTGHIFLIQSNTGVTDIAASASTNPTLPSGYDRKRRIGSIRRVGGAIVAFTQNGDEFLLSSTVTDFVVNNYGDGGIVRTLSVPVGIFVTALCSFSLQNNSSTGSSNEKISSLEQADTPTGTDDCDLKLSAEGAWAVSISTYKPTRTNLSAQIRTRGKGIAPNHWFSCTTHGWIDKRGRQ